MKLLNESARKSLKGQLIASGVVVACGMLILITALWPWITLCAFFVALFYCVYKVYVENV